MSMEDQDVLFIFKNTLEIQSEHMGLHTSKKIWNLEPSFVFPFYLHLLVFEKVLQITKIQRQ